MDNLDELSESGSFIMDLAKTFALSTASTAGVFGGLFVVGLLIEASKKRKSKKVPTLVITNER